MIVETGPVMIMGCKSNVGKNGNTYYNVDVYDSACGDLYNCGASVEVFNQVMSIQKPAQVKSLQIDVRKPYQGASRLDVIGWK